MSSNDTIRAINDLILATNILLRLAVGERRGWLAGPLALVHTALGTWSAAVIGAATSQTASVMVSLLERIEQLEQRIADLEERERRLSAPDVDRPAPAALAARAVGEEAGPQYG